MSGNAFSRKLMSQAMQPVVAAKASFGQRFPLLLADTITLAIMLLTFFSVEGTIFPMLNQFLAVAFALYYLPFHFVYHVAASLPSSTFSDSSYYGAS